MKDLTLVSQIKNGSNHKAITTQIEGMLYAKSGLVLELVKIHEATVLLEADPTPAVWSNEKGDPIVPSSQQWAIHFQDLGASHVQAQVDSNKARKDAVEQAWRVAVKRAEQDKTPENTRHAKHAAAELKNVNMAISTGEAALRKKMSATAKFEKVRTKKFEKHKAGLHKTVHGIVSGLLGGTGLAHHLSHHIANAIAGKKPNGVI